MQSPFIGVSDSCSIRHTKRENQFDVSFFFFFLKTFRFFPYAFFYIKKKHKKTKTKPTPNRVVAQTLPPQ